MIIVAESLAIPNFEISFISTTIIIVMTFSYDHLAVAGSKVIISIVSRKVKLIGIIAIVLLYRPIQIFRTRINNLLITIQCYFNCLEGVRWN